METKNETEIQLMKILFKTNGKKATKNVVSKRAYPYGIEMKYFRQLKGYFKPLTDYVNKYIDENLEPLLHGDSAETRLDTIPGNSFRKMIYNLENWLSVYMPDISELPNNSNNNIIFMGLGKTADEAMNFSEKEFQKIIEKGIHVNLPVSAPWWDDMKQSWAEDNYTLITSNAKNYISKINTLTEQAIINGLSPMKLKEEIKKATESLSDKHCKLLARDQMGKLNGQITEAQMTEIGLDMYVWSTSYDDRVRDSHAIMEGLLCRWDDASICSYDNGKTWVPRPLGAVDLHPGQDIQCRCVALAFYPELEAEVENVPIEDIIENDPYTSELKNNILEGLSEEDESVYNDCYKVFSELDGNKNNAIEISYTCATGDFSKLPSSVLNKSDYEWSIFESKLKKSMELHSDIKEYVLNEFNIARDCYQKGNKIPNFVCTNKEFTDYIKYLKENNILSSYETMFEKNYGYEKYFAFSRRLGDSSAGQKTYYRGLMDYFNLSTKELEKLSYDQFVNNGVIYDFSKCKYLSYFDKNLSRTNLEIGNFNIRHFINISPEVGTPWGTADITNAGYRAIAQFDHEITPFDKTTQKLILGKKIKIDSREAAYGIEQKLYCEQNYPLTKKLSTKYITCNDPLYKGQKFKYHDNEFLRIEFSYTGKPQNYKVGQVLKQTGVFATSPSEFHNAYWYDKKLANGATYPVRFHLKRNEKAHKYLANVIQNDLRKAKYTANNPEEFDFAIGKIKITKIKNGFINGNKNYPVQEIWVEIVD